MKILYVFGGIPPYANTMLNRLVEKNAEIVAVIPARRSKVLGKGVKVIDERQAAYKIIDSREQKTLFGKHYFPDLPEIIEREQPDILVAGWPYFLQFFKYGRLRKALHQNGVRFVIREIPFQVPPYGKIRAYFREHPMYNEDMKLLSRGLLFYLRQWGTMLIRRYCYARADGALAYASLGRTIMPTYGIREERVFVTYNTGDSEALLHEKQMVLQEPPILPENSRRIIHIGRLVKWKRVDLLMDAFASVLKEFPDAELVVVGEGPEREHLESQASALGITERVLFTGGVYDPRTIGAYMSASSLYVLAGMGGLSINDAMAYGLPVICSVCDGTERDLVTHHGNGLFFRENNVADLSEKIALLLRDPALSKRMGEASLRVIEERINLESVSDRYLDAFRKIVS